MIEIKEVDKGVKLIATEYHDVDLNMLYVEKGNYLLDTSTSIQIKQIIDKLGLIPKNAVISHAHLDHAGGSGYLAGQGVNVIAHKISASLLSDQYNGIYSFFPKRYIKWIGEEESLKFINLIKEELGEPKIISTELPSSSIKCFEAFGHVAGAIICEVNGIFFTGDEIQGSGIKGRAETDSIPQISSINDYLLTVYKLIKMKPEIIIPAHNYLPANKRIIDGSDVERFLYTSLESVLKLLVIAESILDKPSTLGEFAQRLLNEYGIKRKIYPQALITAEAIIKYFGKRIIKTKEGEAILYSITK
ncbi:MBL fold metallo-hydrolase [Sulfolobus sp. S-194]|uniref:MBL fold metallo-hydrolase n=1 Tax=Sulfolobus sp. S-194 TaxID=2512240 RepID=UPI00143719B8|nr:MBL fold metallo-hydrolase [Sulfolobus sp. S-194]QIW23812.1 MBL fold metallo-hydrolase [Sulfolobus sp. S-194]